MSTELEHLQASQFYGKGIEHMFPGQAPKVPTPWPSAGKRHDTKPYDEARVHAELAKPAQLHDIDPRDLHATQSSVTRAGVEHYTGDVYHRTGRTFDRTPSEGNTFPVVYRREAHPESYSNEPQNLLLSGHHRAAAALAEGRPLRTRIVEGPWGESRRRT